MGSQILRHDACPVARDEVTPHTHFCSLFGLFKPNFRTWKLLDLCRKLPEYNQLLVLDGSPSHNVAMVDRAHQVRLRIRS